MESIHIKNKEQLQKKIQQCKEDGINQLHIISDFDSTLTKVFQNGKKIVSSYALLRSGKYLSQKYVEKSHALFDKYHPFETSTQINLTEKCEKMNEWWKAHWDLMIESGMNKSVIQDIVENGSVVVRDDFEEFHKILFENNVPLLIFSAGQGDLIQEFFIKNDFMTTNVHLISNFYKFNSIGKVTGYTTPFIHTFNKNEYAIKNTEYYSEIKERKNVILIGDHIGDLQMSQGIKHDVIIRIGFLNSNKEALLNSYLEKFDVVICDDGSLQKINNILKDITLK